MAVWVMPSRGMAIAVEGDAELGAARPRWSLAAGESGTVKSPVVAAATDAGGRAAKPVSRSRAGAVGSVAMGGGGAGGGPTGSGSGTDRGMGVATGFGSV